MLFSVITKYKAKSQKLYTQLYYITYLFVESWKRCINKNFKRQLNRKNAMKLKKKFKKLMLQQYLNKKVTSSIDDEVILYDYWLASHLC